jgi:type IV pilus assembly protein PilE
MRDSRCRLTTGFSLVELCVVLALVGVLATVAWPSMQAQLQRSRRADAVAALMRVQVAQEGFRANNGLYATQLQGLRGASSARSGEGWYDIELVADGPNRYEVRATARAGTVVASDTACAVMRLQVREGLAEFAPAAHCWNH